MQNSWLMRGATFGFVVLIIAALAWLTLPEAEDPCANPQQNVSAAVLADADGDQNALINRAIIIKAKCEK